MAYQHPIGDDHPFRAVYALAQAENMHLLEKVEAHDGALIRLFHRSANLVFKRQGDPGSAMDRQRFDYWTHVRIEDTTPDAMLSDIKRHITDAGLA
ncbi:MAG: hypothetical protein AAFY35_06935 [Pseudomonadota bacterium]